MNVQSAGKLEDLFIQKLSEKFKLTERGLKHAFAKYDKSRDGLLDIEELFTLAKHLLNGIKVEDIHRLVSLYDVNGDGKISFEELHGMLTNRDVKRNVSSMDQEELATPLPRAAAVEAWGEESEPPLSARSEVSDETSASASRYSRSDVTASSRSHVSINDQYAIDSRAGLYLKNLKTLLLKRAMTMRDEGQIPSQIRLSMHSNQLLETTAISLLSRAFRPYTFSDGKLGASAVEQTSGARIRLSDFCVSRADFTRVLRGFTFHGSQPPQTIVIDYLFNMCCSPGLAQTADRLASPSALVHLVFPPPKETVLVAPPESSGMGVIRNGARVDKHEFADASLVPRRAEVGRGPLVNLDNCLPLAVADLPLKFISRKSRTALKASSTIDAAALNRSNQLPPYACAVDHVFGVSSSRMSTSSIHAIASGIPTFDKDDCLVYSAAALGVIHDLKTNTQFFFDQHTDDITCMSACKPSRLVASGECGKSPVLLIWTYAFNTRGGCDIALVSTIGKRFFQRMVVSVALSFDGAFVAAVSGDDHHTLGVWDVRSGALCVETACQNGIPPQIRGLCWAPSRVTTEWISSSDNPGPCDLLCTVGERHLKFWSFARPGSSGRDAVVKSCGGKIGKANATAPKIYLCADFVSCDSGKFFDVVTGGSNGSAYLWRKGALIATVSVCRGYLSCLQVHGTSVVCGGIGGCVKVLDARTLSVISTYNATSVATGDISGGAAARPSSASASGSRQLSRSVSAGRPRSASSAGRPTAPIAGASHGEEGPPKAAVDAMVTGLTIMQDRRSVHGLRLSVVVTTSAGVAVTINLEDGSSSALMHYHFGSVNAAARFVSRSEDVKMIATGGEDKLLCVWDTRAMQLVCRRKLQSAVLCADVDSSSELIAAGLSSGGLVLLALSDRMLSETAYRKDSKEGISDVKFNATGDSICAGSHDNYVYVYTCSAAPAVEKKGDRGEVIRSKKQFILRPIHRLRGHSSYITHVDWSRDGTLIRSTCGAYELLLWDSSSGRAATGVVEADVNWSTHTCVLGFAVMGIWPKYSDGTDINAVSVSKKKNIISTADDFGKLSILNFPCIVSAAPKRSYNGHSSHVSNVCFNGYYDDQLATTGGQDCAVIVWSIGSI